MRTFVVVLTLLFASLLLIGCGGGEAVAPEEETTVAGAGTPESSVTITNSAGALVPVMVEIADTNAERQRGLMERDELAEDAGMLFVFDREEPRSFWMRNTRIPLSIAYIDAEGRIVDIKDMEPFDETPVPSAEPAQYALEVNQGFFAEQGIEVGDVAELPPAR